MVENVLNIFMEHSLNILMIFGVKEKSIILCYMLKCMIVSVSFIQSTLQISVKPDICNNQPISRQYVHILRVANSYEFVGMSYT